MSYSIHKYRCPNKKSNCSRPTYLSDDGTSHHSSCMIGYSCSLPSMAPRGPSLLCWASFCPLPHATGGSRVKWVAPQLDIFLFELAATDLTYLRWILVNYIGHTKIYCFSPIDPKGCIFGHLGPIINMKHSRLHSMLEHNWYKWTTTLWEVSLFIYFFDFLVNCLKNKLCYNKVLL